MFFALGAASSILEGLQSLGSSKSSTNKQGNAGSGLFDLLSGSSAAANASSSTAASGGSQISPQTMSALIAAQSDSSATASSASAAAGTTDPLQDLFAKIDGNGDGTISKSEFENALGAGGTNVANADSVFSKLDQNGDGNVSMDEMSSALKGAGGHHGHHHAASSSDSASASSASSSNADALLQAMSDADDSQNSNDGSSRPKTSPGLTDITAATQQLAHTAYNQPLQAMPNASSYVSSVSFSV